MGCINHQFDGWCQWHCYTHMTRFLHGKCPKISQKFWYNVANGVRNWASWLRFPLQISARPYMVKNVKISQRPGISSSKTSTWLVGFRLPLWKKYEFVHGADYSMPIPKWMENKIHVPNHQAVLLGAIPVQASFPVKMVSSVTIPTWATVASNA